MKRPLLCSLLVAASLACGAGTLSPALAAPAPLTLDAAIARAIATHPDAALARTQIDQADLSVADVRAQRLQLSADASVLGRHAQTGLMGPNPPGSATDQTGINGTVGLTVPIFTGGKLSRSLQAAEHGRDAAAFQGSMTLAELQFEVTRGYWTLARQEALALVQAEAIAQSKRVLALTKTSRDLGRLTANDVDRADVDVLTTQDALLRAQAQVDEARARFASLLGLPPADLRLAETASSEAEPMAFWPDPAAATEAHPRVAAAQARLAAAEANVAAANGERWPQLALMTTYQHGNNPFDPLSGARGIGTFSGTWDARVSASLNIFDNGRIGRQVAKSELEATAARATLEKTRREVRSGIDLALIRLRSAQDRLALADRSTGLAQKTLGWIEKRYELGYSLLVEVHESRRSLLSAQTQRIDARVDYQIARAELALALGRTESKESRR